MKKAYCNLTFIDSYTTWNLSAQDSLLRDKPTLCYDHPTLRAVIGEKYPFYFKTKQEFKKMLYRLPEKIDFKETLQSHDTIFKNNLLNAIEETWQKGGNEPKNAFKYVDLIKRGITTKQEINDKVNPNIIFNGSNHFIRRYLLNNGVRDDINNPYTDYFIENLEDVKGFKNCEEFNNVINSKQTKLFV